MSYENASGLGVYNQYGARQSGGAVGTEHRYGSNVTLKIDLTGDSINDAVAGFVPPVSIPKGANFNTARLVVDEAFDVGGTTPHVLVGAAGSVATNGVEITEAELEATGTKELASTGAGTWAFNSATGTTAAALVAFALEGDTTVARGSGKATLILEFTFNTKV